MSDEADTAAALQAIANESAVAEHQRRTKVIRSTWCVECDELIPHQRRVLGVCRCIGCQRVWEARQ